MNFLIVTGHADNHAIYEDFDWYNKPVASFGMIFVLLGLNVLIFALLWAFTMKVKLPAYKERDDTRLGGLGSESGTFNPVP